MERLEKERQTYRSPGCKVVILQQLSRICSTSDPGTDGKGNDFEWDD